MDRKDLVVFLVAAVMVAAALALIVVAISVPPPAQQVTISATLEPAGWAGHFPSNFWAVTGHTAARDGFTSDKGLQSFLNRSPIRFVRYGASSDACDPIADVYYQDNGTPRGPCGIEPSSFRSFCTSTVPACTSIYELPGEPNNSALDGQIASWLQHTVGFQPTYFAFGNEPGHWSHYGIPWRSWSFTDNSTPTPLGYAVGVRSGIAAVRAVDPGAQFVGIEAAGPHLTSWFTTLMAVDGPDLAAVAFHLYPAAPGPTEPTVEQMYAQLAGPNNISTSYDLVRDTIQAACGCEGPTVQIGEYNAGPVPAQTGNFPPLVPQYPDAVFIAASIDQALAAGVPVLTLYNLQDPTSQFEFGMLNSQDATTPVGQLYASLLPGFSGSTIERLSVRGSPNTWATALVTNVSTGQRVSVLIANAQVSTGVVLDVTPVLGRSMSAGTTSWAPGEAGPVSEGSVEIGPNVTIPPQGILLINGSTSVNNATVRAVGLLGVRPAAEHAGPEAVGTALAVRGLAAAYGPPAAAVRPAGSPSGPGRRSARLRTTRYDVPCACSAGRRAGRG